MAAAIDLPPTTSSLYPLFFLFLFFFLIIFFPASAQADSQSDDAQALIDFKNKLESAEKLSSNWSDISTVCSNWKGITCSNVSGSSSMRVVKVELPGMDLVGAIAPNTLAKLDALQTLHLRNNRLNGSIPQDLSNCKSLKSISLSHNSFSGPLPSNLSTAWPDLSDLDLSSNNVNGSIPQDLSICKSLQSINLSHNNLSGPLPSNLSSVWPVISDLDLSSNHLDGSIPEDLSNCTQLKSMNLSHNSFSGPLPSDLSVWPYNLSDLDLSSNRLSGQIPSSLDNLTSLQILLLNDNEFSGSLPLLSTVASHLLNFSVANNQLNGSVPDSLSNLFPATSFEGNAGLCGKPLPLNCSSSSSSPPSSGPSSSDRKSGRAIAGAVAGSVAGAAVLLIGICVLLLVLRGSARKNRRSTEVENGDLWNSAAGNQGLLSEAPTDVDVHGIHGGADEELTFVGSSGKSNSAQTYDLEELLRASAVVLGKGKHGTTYKTTLNNGAVLRVKRLKGISLEQDACKNVLLNLGRLSDHPHHPNLFPLRAFYVAPQETLLISDYMSDSRSLSSSLRGENKSKKEEVLMNKSKEEEEQQVKMMMMSWEARLGAAHGAALGLFYLHSQKKVVHGGVKSSNVILDKQGNPRWTDYGLHQLFHGSSTTSERKATTHKKKMEAYYYPPELITAITTFKDDIYAFGVLLLELITGMSPRGLSQAASGNPLHDWAQSKASAADEALDSVFLQQGHHGRMDPVSRNQMRDMLIIAQRCLALSPDERPEMSEVAEKIENLRKIGSSAGVDDHGLGSQLQGESQKDAFS